VWGRGANLDSASHEIFTVMEYMERGSVFSIIKSPLAVRPFFEIAL
jgi:hypothetical protein